MMWIGRMGALVTKLPEIVNVFVGGRSRDRRLEATLAWPTRRLKRRVSALYGFQN